MKWWSWSRTWRGKGLALIEHNPEVDVHELGRTGVDQNILAVAVADAHDMTDHARGRERTGVGEPPLIPRALGWVELG